jgi:probable F420-dependent oxidoreductase
MRFGVFMFPSCDAIDIAELASESEAAGFDTLLFPEHTHVPLVGGSDHPAGPMPDSYARLLDPLLSMTVAATATTTLRVGTGICLIPQRDPITFAKEIATLEHLSGGRVELGFGVGWNRKEASNHGIDPSKRWAIMREKLLAAKEIWTSEEAEFHGEHVDFDRLALYPKPVQQPHTPILIGGNSDRAMDAVLEYGDGWMPSLGLSEFNVRDRVEGLHRRAAEQGRGRLPVVLMRPVETPDALADYADAGVSEVVFGLPTSQRDKVLPELERLSALVSECTR